MVFATLHYFPFSFSIFLSISSILIIFYIKKKAIRAVNNRIEKEKTTNNLTFYYHCILCGTKHNWFLVLNVNQRQKDYVKNIISGKVILKNDCCII